MRLLRLTDAKEFVVDDDPKMGPDVFFASKAMVGAGTRAIAVTKRTASSPGTRIGKCNVCVRPHAPPRVCSTHLLHTSGKLD